MDRLCRVCMSMEGTKRFKNLFDKRYEFAENLFYVSEIIIFEISNNIPALICRQCEVDLETAARVKKMSLETDAFLRTMSSTADIQLLTNVINNEYEENEIKEDPDDIIGAFRGFEVDPSLIKLELNEEIIQYEEVMEPTFDDRLSDFKEKLKRPHKAHYCQVEGCNMKFPVASQLQRHMYKHSDARDFRCEQCGKAYKNVHYLRHHMKKHTQAHLRWICDLCGSSFPGKHNIIKHIKRTHLRLYTEVCHLCGKSISTKDMLKIHMLYTHNPDKRDFKCDICSKAFFTKPKLNAHMLLHGDRPWPCEICGKGFTKRYKVGEHMKAVHEKKYKDTNQKHVCTLCGIFFDRNKALQEHLRMKHEVVVEEIQDENNF